MRVSARDAKPLFTSHSRGQEIRPCASLLLVYHGLVASKKSFLQSALVTKSNRARMSDTLPQ